jgi:hypothetical protein
LITPIPNLQREVALVKEDHHRAHNLLNLDVAAVKNKLTALAAAPEICLYFRQLRITFGEKHQYKQLKSDQTPTRKPSSFRNMTVSLN